MTFLDNNINNIMKQKVLRPKAWACGTEDPVDHRLYVDCVRSRCQAHYRGEEWHITTAEYIALWRWQDQYLYKGRARGDLCLTRIDHELAWTLDNVHIISRYEHYQVVGLKSAHNNRQRRMIK